MMRHLLLIAIIIIINSISYNNLISSEIILTEINKYLVRIQKTFAINFANTELLSYLKPELLGKLSSRRPSSRFFLAGVSWELNFVR